MVGKRKKSQLSQNVDLETKNESALKLDNLVLKSSDETLTIPEKRIRLNENSNGNISSITENLESKIQNKRSNTYDGQLGGDYQTNILLLFLVWGVHNNYDFHLTTEKQEKAGKFDDVIFDFLKDGRKIYRFLQSKHRKHEKKHNIKFKNLLSLEDDFSLPKYLNSFVNIKNDEGYKDGTIKDVILYTNINFNLNSKYESKNFSLSMGNVINEVLAEDEILDIGVEELAKNCKRYKFNDNIIPLLQNSRLKYLIFKLTDCLLKNQIINISKKNIFHIYHIPLANEVIDIKNKKFHEKFINNKEISEDAKVFREHFEDEMKKKSGITLENLNEAIDKGELFLNLSNKFGEGEHQNWPNNFEDSDIKLFFEHLVFAVNQPNKDQLEMAIKKYIAKNFNLTLTSIDTTFEKLSRNMQEWMEGKGKEFLTRDNGYNWLKTIETDFIINYEMQKFNDHIKQLGIHFNKTVIQNSSLHGFFSSNNSITQVFNILTEESSLTTIKIHQIIKNIFKSENKYIFIGLREIIKYQKFVIEVFKTRDVLLIDCNTNENEENFKKINLAFDIISILNTNSQKKIVLITQQDQILGNALKDEIKNKYQKEHDEHFPLIDLTNETIKNILEKSEVYFQGKKVISRLFMKDLKYLIDGTTLLKLIKNKHIEIGQPLPDFNGDIKAYLMNRKLNREIFINKSFINETDKFLVVESCKNELLKNISENQDIVVICEKMYDYFELCENYKERNIHWIRKENKKFRWVQTKNSLSKLLEFQYRTNELKDLTEINRVNDKIIIISGEAGIGKTTLITDIAHKLKEFNNFQWVIRVNLLDCVKIFKNWQSNNIKIELKEVLKFLFEISFCFQEDKNNKKNEIKQKIINDLDSYINYNNNNISLKNIKNNKIKGSVLLEFGIFLHYYNQGQLIILLDGFDEIVPNYNTQVIDLLKTLKTIKLKQLWVTTRIYNILYTLEDVLNTFSYELEPFSSTEQTNFLEKFWNTKLKFSVIKQNRFQYFVKLIQQNDLNGFKFHRKSFLAIPLHLRLVAETFQDIFEEYNKSENDELTVDQMKLLTRKLNLSSLYKSFMKKKFYDVLISEKRPHINLDDPFEIDICEIQYKETIENCKKLAIYTLLSKQEIETLFPEQLNFNPSDLINNIKNGNEKIGIFMQVNNDQLKFVHKTYGEYFVAIYLWEKFFSIQLNDTEELSKSIIKFVADNNNIINFFVAAVQNDVEDINLKNKFKCICHKIIFLLIDLAIYANFFLFKNDFCGFLLCNMTKIFLENDEIITQEILNDIEMEKRLDFINIAINRGYINLFDLLIKKVKANSFQDYLKKKSWFCSHIFQAYRKDYDEILKSLVEKKLYKSNWYDVDGLNLIQYLIKTNLFHTLCEFIKIGAIECNTSYEVKDIKRSILADCIINIEASDKKIEFLIEQADIEIMNVLMLSNENDACINICNGLLIRDISTTKVFIKKGFDLSTLLIEFLQKIFNDYFIKSKFINDRADNEFHDLKNILIRLELLLQKVTLMSYKNNMHELTALNYCEQMCYIYKILFKLSKHSNVSDILFNLLIDCSTTLKFKSIILKADQISLKYDNNINVDIIPYRLTPFYKNFNLTADLDEIFNYTFNQLSIFSYPFILQDNLKLQVKNPLEECIINIGYKILKYCDNQNDAIQKAKQELLNFKKTFEKIKLKDFENSNKLESLETDEILDVLNIKKIDADKEILYLLSKIHKDNFSLLIKLWSNLNFHCDEISKKIVLELIEETTEIFNFLQPYHNI